MIKSILFAMESARVIIHTAVIQALIWDIVVWMVGQAVAHTHLPIILVGAVLKDARF